MKSSSDTYAPHVRAVISLALAMACWFVVHASVSHAQNQSNIVALIDRVNRQVNGEIRPISDASTGAYPDAKMNNLAWGFGADAEARHQARLIVNHWLFRTEEERGDHYGNCRTYAATKRARLIALGVPPTALSIWIVYVRKFPNESHAVLQVVVPVNGQMRYLILDNLSPWIVDRADLERYGEYRFLAPVEL